MSKSSSPPRSTRNTPTNPSSPPSTTTAATTSRPHIHEQSPSLTAGERQLPSPIASFTLATSAGSSRTRAREEDDPSELPMAKRFHDDPSMRARPSDRSSPSSDSQGGMADTEDAERSQQSEKSAAPSAAPKKKRTRTLTTPHQSAVLHALLRESRFPTTAMREEVGRSIGLSARKVQIWFQNQRQKARRPRTQSQTSLSRPPQYGAFPSGPDAESVSLYPRPQQGDLSEMDPRSQQGHYDDPRAYQQYSLPIPPSSLGSPSQLLGPGVPGHGPTAGGGPSSSIHPGSEGSLSSPTSTRSRFFRDYLPYRRSPTPPRMYPLPLPRPASSHHHSSGISSSTSFRDSSRTLPPLTFPPPQPSGSTSRYPSYPSVRSAPAHIAPPYPFRQHHHQQQQPPFSSSSHESMMDNRLPEPSSSSSAAAAALPPPMTLQPQPQWNDPVYTSIPVPRTTTTRGSSSWSTQGSSDRGDSLSPTTSRLPGPSRILEEAERHGHGEQLVNTARGGRYDPVRSTFVPYRSPSRSPRSPGSEKR